MLNTNKLAFGYSRDKSFEFPDIHCKKGETCLIIGNSGTGKTTLLNLIGLLLKPTSGEISLDGQSTGPLSAKEIISFRANNIGIIYQKSHFVNSLNVIDNLMLANYLAGKEQSKARATELSQALGFEALLSKPIQFLSGGEQQRVSIARSVMNAPKLILADEPTSNLDDENCEKVISLLENQARNIGAALLIVTHDQRLKSKFINQITL